MNRYLLAVFDCAGLYEETRATELTPLIEACREKRGTPEYKRRVFRFYNEDNIDLNFDGLTEEEDELIAEALS